MWSLLGQMGRPARPGDNGVSLGPKFDAVNLAGRYQQLRATSSAVLDYAAKQRAGSVPDPVKETATSDLDGLVKSGDLTTKEISKVKAIRSNVSSGQPLTAADLKVLTDIVDGLEARIVNNEKATVADKDTTDANLGQLATDGATTGVQVAAIDELAKRAKHTFSEQEMLELIKPAGVRGATIENVLQAMATNPNATEKVLTEVMKQAHGPDTELAIANHLHSSVETLQQLVKSGQSPEIKAAALKALVERGQHSLLQSDQESLLKQGSLTDGEFDQVLQGLGANHNAPKEILAGILKQPHSEATELAVAGNFHTSTETLIGLDLKGQSPKVKAAARDALVDRAEHDLIEADQRELLNATGLPDAERDLIAKAVGRNRNASAETKELAVIANPSTDLNALLGLKEKGQSASVKEQAALALRKRPDDLLDRFTKLEHGITTAGQYAEMRKLAAAADPETRTKMIALLLDHRVLSNDARNSVRDILKDARGPVASPAPLDFQRTLIGLDPALLKDKLSSDAYKDTRALVDKSLADLQDPAQPLPDDEKVQQFIQAQPKVPVERLDALNQQGKTDGIKQDAERLLLARATASTDPAELDKLGKSASTKVRDAVAANGNTSADTLAGLADLSQAPPPAASTLQLVCQHAHTKIETLTALFTNSADPAVKAAAETALATRAAASTDFRELGNLAKLPSTKIKDAVAGNGVAQEETLAELTDPSKVPAPAASTLRLVAANHNAKLETVIDLHGRPGDPLLTQAATTELARRAGLTTSTADMRKLVAVADPAINLALAGNVAGTPENLKEPLTAISTSAGLDDATRLALAGNPKAPIGPLLVLAASPNLPIQNAAKANLATHAATSTDPKELEAMVPAAGDKGIRDALAANPLTPPDALEKLVDLTQAVGFNAADAAITQDLVANHPWAPAKLLDHLRTTGVDAVVKADALAGMIQRAQSSTLPPDLRYLLAHTANPDIRDGLADNGDITPDIARALEADANTTDVTRQKLIANQQSPPDVLDLLSKGTNSAPIKAAAQAAMAQRARNSDDPGQLRQLLALNKTPDVLRALLANPATPTDVLADLGNAASPPTADPVLQAELQLGIAGNPRAPVATVRALMDNAALPAATRAKAKQTLVADATTSADPAVLRALAKVPDADVAKALAANGATPADAIDALADPASPDQDLLKALAVHPKVKVDTLHRLLAGAPDPVKDKARATMIARAGASKDPTELRALTIDAGNDDLRKALAGNPNTPADVLLEITDPVKMPKTDEATQLLALANPAVTEAVLKQLESSGATPAIKTAATAALAGYTTARNVADPALGPQLHTLAAAHPNRELALLLIANPTTPNNDAASLIAADNKFEPAELDALRARFMSGKVSRADMENMLKAANLSDPAALRLAELLTSEDKVFNTVFGVGTPNRPTVALELRGGKLELVDHVGYDQVTRTTDPAITNRIFPNPAKPVEPLRAPAEDITIGTPTPTTIVSSYKDGNGVLQTRNVPGLSYPVTIGGKTINVIYPRDGTTVGMLPTMDQVVKGLALMPPVMRATVGQVIMQPERNEDDDYWAVQYKNAHFVSQATGGPADDGTGTGTNVGTINFFPMNGPSSQASIDATMLHEGGHNVSRAGPDLDKQPAWTDAMAADGLLAASSYGDSSTAEDFAEVTVLYLLGGKDDPATRARFSHRFAELDKIYH